MHHPIAYPNDRMSIKMTLCNLCFMFACRPAAQIGRQLAVIGDDINRRYDTHFNHMIYLMNLTPETAYEAFAGVARK